MVQILADKGLCGGKHVRVTMYALRRRAGARQPRITLRLLRAASGFVTKACSCYETDCASGSAQSSDRLTAVVVQPRSAGPCRGPPVKAVHRGLGKIHPVFLHPRQGPADHVCTWRGAAGQNLCAVALVAMPPPFRRKHVL